MVVKADQQRMKALLKETITLLCKNGLNYKSEFCVEALIGITLDKDDVFLVNINETIRDGLLAAKVESSEADTCAEVASPISADQYGYEAIGDDGSSGSSHKGRRRRRSKQDRPTSPNKSRPASSPHRQSVPSSSRVGETGDELSMGSFKVEGDDQLSSCRFSSYGEQNRSDSEMNTQSMNKRTHDYGAEDDHDDTEKDESQSAHSISSKRLRSDDDGSHGSDDVVFIKDEPFSDSELEQVSLGIAHHAQSQAISELGYMPGTSQSGIPSGHSEPLPGCSGWAIPASGAGVPAALGAPPGDSQSSANTSLGQAIPFEAGKPHVAAENRLAFAHHSRGLLRTGRAALQRLTGPLSNKALFGNLQKCTLCNYQSSNPHNFRRHLTTHYQSLRYACKLCNRSYVNSYNLRIHMQLSHGLSSHKHDNTDSTS